MLDFIIAVFVLIFLILAFCVQTYCIYIISKDWKRIHNPSLITKYTDYYFYLIFSSKKRIGNLDFARGILMWIFFSLFSLCYLMILMLFIDALNGIFIHLINQKLFTSGFEYIIIVFMSAFYFVLVIITYWNLARKRLMDLNYDVGDTMMIIFISIILSIFYFAGIIIFSVYCSIVPGNKWKNKYGKPSEIYSRVKKRKANLTAWAKYSLDANDFKEAIKYYTQLEDSGAVQRTKKKHLLHIFSMLDSKINQMKKKNILYRDMENNKDEIKKQLIKEMWINENDKSKEIEIETEFVPGVAVVHEKFGKGKVVDSKKRKNNSYKIKTIYDDGVERTTESSFVDIVEEDEDKEENVFYEIIEEGDEEE